MSDNKYKKFYEPAFLLDFNVNKLLSEVKNDLRLYDIKLDINGEIEGETIVSSFNKSTEVEIEKIDSENNQTRSIFLKKDGSGNYISVKNFSFNLAIFIEGIKVLMMDFKPIPIMILLLNLKKQITIPLNRHQILIYSIIFCETKKRMLTGENILKIINENIEISGYSKKDDIEIFEILNELHKLDIISIDSDTYSINQKMYFVFN